MIEGMVELQPSLPSALEVSPEDDIFLMVVTAEGFPDFFMALKEV